MPASKVEQPERFPSRQAGLGSDPSLLYKPAQNLLARRFPATAARDTTEFSICVGRSDRDFFAALSTNEAGHILRARDFSIGDGYGVLGYRLAASSFRQNSDSPNSVVSRLSDCRQRSGHAD